jgi:hypothetical protein
MTSPRLASLLLLLSLAACAGRVRAPGLVAVRSGPGHDSLNLQLSSPGYLVVFEARPYVSLTRISPDAVCPVTILTLPVPAAAFYPLPVRHSDEMPRVMVESRPGGLLTSLGETPPPWAAARLVRDPSPGGRIGPRLGYGMAWIVALLPGPASNDLDSLVTRIHPSELGTAEDAARRVAAALGLESTRVQVVSLR